MKLIFGQFMTTVTVASLIILYFSVFILLVLFKSGPKSGMSAKDTLLGILPPVGAILLLSSDVIYYRAINSSVVYELAFSVLMIPRGGHSGTDRTEKVVLLSMFCAAFILFFLRLPFVSLPDSWAAVLPVVMPIAAVAVPMVLHWHLLSGKLRDRKKYSCGISFSQYVKESLASGQYILLLMILAFMPVLASAGEPVFKVFSIIMILVLLFLYLVCFQSACGRFPLRHLPKSLYETLHIASEDCMQQEKVKEDFNQRALFDRMTTLFKESRPYLDSNLSINDVAKLLYTNKVYISKSISVYTGRNFCQFVNYFRVMYSIEYFTENPEMKMSSLAMASGFNSLVSYNSAFKLFLKEIPSDWFRKYRAGYVCQPVCVLERQKEL